MKRLTYSFFSLLLTISLIASPLKGQVFKYFSDREGAPVAVVFSITQDQTGYLWFGTTIGLFRYDSRNFKQYKHAPDDPSSLPADVVRKVFCDTEGRLWIGTEGGGLSLYSSETDSFIHCLKNEKNTHEPERTTVYTLLEDAQKRLWAGTSDGLDRVEINANNTIYLNSALPREIQGDTRAVRALAEGKNGELWLGTYEGLIRYEDGKKTKVFRRPGDNHNSLINQYLTLYVDEDETIWMGSNHKGLTLFDTKTESFRTLYDFTSEKGELPIVNEIVAADSNVYWIATESGLARYDRQNKTSKWYVHQAEKSYSLVDDILYSVYVDRHKNVWTGSYYAGISFLNLQNPEFEHWPARESKLLGVDFSNGWMGVSPDGKKWCIDYEKTQLAIFGSRSSEPLLQPLHLDFPETYSSFYLDDENQLWCARKTSLTCLNVATGKTQNYPYLADRSGNTYSGKAYHILEDQRNQLWVGGMFGLMMFDKASGEFRKRYAIDQVWNMFEDSQGDLWIACANEVFLIEKGASLLKRVPVISEKKFNKKYIAYRIAEDTSGRIWVATKNGLLRFEETAGGLVPYNEISNTDFGAIFDIQVDQMGYLWMNGYHKLIRYHPEKGGLQTYDYQDGLPDRAILQFAGSCKDAEGNFYFITNKAIFSFDPHRMVDNTLASALALTSIKLFGKPVSTEEKSALFRTSTKGADVISFRHDQNVFTLDFALLSFFRSERHRYAYKMEGFESEWNYVDIPTATYTNLPPGSYTFLAKAANGDGYWMEAPLRIDMKVLPPWWATWYAYALYSLLFVGIVYGVTRFFWLRSAFRKENEFYQAKLDFFTNISHEIRTHLLLISSPIEKAIKLSTVGEEAKEVLTYAKNSSDRLMRLVDELLDFRKLQNGKIKLQVSEQNVVKALTNALAAFEHQAKEKSIRTVVDVPEEPIMLWFDSTQMQKVFYNLLSNAYKFATEGGQVTVAVTTEENEVLIKISDNGIGIAPEHLPNLFTNFFQVNDNNSSNTGYGIGLALSKSIVELHGGRILATSRRGTQSEPGETCFTVCLRWGTSHLEDADSIEKSKKSVPIPQQNGIGVLEPSLKHGNEKKHSLLIIEDNDELRAFAVEMFRDRYRVYEADNGNVGLKLAIEKIPDLVICDVMMPEMNGLEVCSTLKTDFNTRHIPVVLVSARSTVSQMKEGLNAGADDYLIKPFDFAILAMKIENLIQVREALAQQYSRIVQLEPGELIADDPDAAFINQLKDIVMENLADSKFGVNEIALHTGISVSVLYRKLRALTGMTVNDFVKSLRLKRASQLLELGHYNVNEVATEVGFEDTRYFSREFRKVFGKTPNEVKRLAQEERNNAE